MTTERSKARSPLMEVYPVLLVHGIDDTGGRFRRMRKVLLEHGFAPVWAMNIVPPDASISLEAMGHQVRETADTLRHTAGKRMLDIVAYSMGALAARYYVQRLEGRAVVRRYISIAGPHHGTLAAYLRQNEGSRQMRPGSVFLHQLNAELDWGKVEAHSFWSPMDLMVLPATSSILEQAHNRAFGILFHRWMVSDGRVIRAVVQTLKQH